VYSFGTLFMTGLVCLFFGAAMGALILQVFRAKILEHSLEKQLYDSEHSLQSYQRDVTEHFAKTAQLVNNLTDAYRDVHKHLATGALKLATPAISREIMNSVQSYNNPTSTFTDETQVEPPKDWAPKKPGRKGVLSEDYDLRDDRDDTEEHPQRPTEMVEDFHFDEPKPAR
jgi:uncharacterized protein